MKNKWSIIPAVIALILSVGIAAAQVEPTLSNPQGQGRPGSPRDVATLTNVTVHPGKEGVSVEITCSRPITPTPTMINDPSRLVLDFADTISANRQNRINVDQDGLKSVRIGVQLVDPPTTRVVLDLEQSRAYQLVSDGNKLTVKLSREELSGATIKSDAAAGKQISSAVEPGSIPESPATAQTSTLAAALATQASPAAAEPEAAANANSSVTGQGSDSSAQPRTDAAKTAATQEAAAVPPADKANPDKAVAMSPSSAINLIAARQQSGESKPMATAGDQMAGARIPAGNDNSGNATSATPQAQDQATQGHSSAPQAKTSPAPDDPAPRAPDTQPLSLAAAKVAPDLPVAPAPPKPVSVQPTPGDYLIGEQDVLSIVVWKERELSATVVVRPDGKITLPLVDEVKVIGMTPAQLQAMLTEKFKPFLNIPQVTVEVVQINSRKAYLIGEVQKTGTFPLNSSTTVLQIIAEAGGLRDFAKRKDIYILRNQKGNQVRYRFNYDEVIRGKNTQQNIVLQPGDMVVVP
jgi:polysaccharide biosynthesis/export protein